MSEILIPEDLREMYEKGGDPAHEPLSPYAYICGLIERIARAEAKVAALEAERSRYASIEGKDHLQTIDERDAAEDAISQAYFLIIGKSPEWSNLFRYEQAIEEINDAQCCLRADIKALEAEREALDDLQGRLWCALGKPVGVEYVQAVRNMKNRNEALEAEKDKALAANERDRTTLHQVLRQIDAEITGRMWLIEGRGAYEWDDDRYRREFGWAVNALQEKLEALRRIASDLTDSPTTQAAVEMARAQQPSPAQYKEQP